MKTWQGVHTRYVARPHSSLADWQRYAGWLRVQARVSLGVAPEPVHTPLRAKVFGRWVGNGYSCEKVYFESLPGFYVTGNLFRPVGARPARRLPGILCPHGHWADGRLHDHDVHGSVVARCIELARLGAVVFNYDMVGYNDSCQVPHAGLEPDVHYGLSMMALHTWNSIRAVDFLIALPDVDPRRLGVTGASGGGTQTFALCAVDDRLAVAAPVCMISLSMQGGCVCENAPLLRLEANNVDLARLFAPKPLFMGSCTGDWTANTPTAEFPAVRRVYQLLRATGNLVHHQVDFGHNYNQEMREHVYGFFNRFLFGAKSARPVPEPSVARPPFRDRMVWWGRPAPDPLSARELRALWRQHIETGLRPHLTNAKTVRAHLGPLLAAAAGLTPTSVESYRGVKPRSVAIREDHGTLIVSPSRTKPLPVPEDLKFTETYNRTPFADRVHEILAAVENRGGAVALQGLDTAGPACLVAAALSPRVTAADVDLCGFDPDVEAHWTQFMDTPSIRQVGGLVPVFAMMGRRPLQTHHASDGAKALMGRFCR